MNRLRVPRRWLCLAALSVAVAAAAATLGPAAHAAAGLAPGEQAHRVAAAADAAALLHRLVLPAGATASAAEPDGDGGRLSRPALYPPFYLKTVDVTGWWRVPDSLAAATSFVRHHGPAGATWTGSGLTGGGRPPQPVEDFVTFQWPPVTGVLGQRQLVVSLAPLPGGGTAVRADAQVQWIVPRPRTEVVPPEARVLGVTVAVPGQSPSVSVIVTSRRTVAAVAGLIDRLQIVQPSGAMSCPAFPNSAPVVTFTFRAGLDGAVLARAIARADLQATGPCFAMAFWIRGHRQPALLDGGTAIRGAQRLLGVRLSGLAPARH